MYIKDRGNDNYMEKNDQLQELIWMRYNIFWFSFEIRSYSTFSEFYFGFENFGILAE